METQPTNILPPSAEPPQFKPNILHYVVGFFDDKTPYLQYINRSGQVSKLDMCAQFNAPAAAIKLASYLSTWKGGGGRTYKVFSVYSDGKVRQMNEGTEKDGDYKIMRNPWNKLWYVAMRIQKNKWTPVGKGHSNERDAIKYMKKREKTLEGIRNKVTESPHFESGKLSVDLRIERYPISLLEKKKLMNQLNSDEGIVAFSKKLGRTLRFKKTGITVMHTKNYDTASSIQLPEYWERYALWSR